MYSGPATGCESGTVLGHIGTCVCPGDGCQEAVCAPKARTPETTKRARNRRFIFTLHLIHRLAMLRAV
jgi:hypothetical protein